MEKYYQSDNGKIYIKVVTPEDKLWGWYFWYGDIWNMCARSPDENKLKEITKEEIDLLMFVEKL